MHKPFRTIGVPVLALGMLLPGAPSAAQVSAASQTPTQAPTFATIAKLALATHPAVLAKMSSSDATRADLESAKWQRYPTPSLELNNDDSNTRTTLLRVQQPLWAGGRIDAGIDAASSRNRASEVAIGEAKEEIAQKVIAAYIEALRQKGRRETIASGVEQHERLLGLISRRVAQDASPRVDRELAQSRLFQANNDLSSVTQALANALTQLSQLSGIRVRDVAPLEDGGALNIDSREAALAQAVAWSPTLRRLRFEEQAAQADVEVKRASYLPQLSVRYEHSYASAPVNGLPSFSTNRVMLVLEAQTGAGLSALSGADAALAKRNAVAQERAAALRDIEQQVSLDWDELLAARTRLDNASRASESSKEVYESYARQYTAGRKTWLDVLNVVRESTQSDVATTDARAQVAGALLRLKLTTGNLEGLAE